MATIKPIDGHSVHRIQSGQVIVDLCSVVKELVENSIDSGASIIDVRFRNQGLDMIEVQDNGSGIARANYDSVALKHHTSKLSSYADIDTLETFGFRGEALASLSALSKLVIITCVAADVPKASKLSFSSSGKLEGITVVAAQKGTTVSVEKLFHNLPVRRRELERNIKREWQKVIGLLNQYACIQTNLKFSVSQQPNKGKRIMLFSTKGNLTTRENIINIFGAKAMSAILPLDLKLEMQPSTTKPTSLALRHPVSASSEVRIAGHVSRPVHGDGRQTPDRQMFFINGRPCGLPQFVKAFNDVYKTYNFTQSPFILADIRLDTHMYDVNVSPDKRSILLHDQQQLLDSLRVSLMALFDAQDHTVPVVQPSSANSKSSVKPIPQGDVTFTTSQTHIVASQEDEGSNSECDDEWAQDNSSSDEDVSRNLLESSMVSHSGRNTFGSKEEQGGREKSKQQQVQLSLSPSMTRARSSKDIKLRKDPELTSIISYYAASPHQKTSLLNKEEADGPQSSDDYEAIQSPKQLSPNKIAPTDTSHSSPNIIQIEASKADTPYLQHVELDQMPHATVRQALRPSKRPLLEAATVTIGNEPVVDDTPTKRARTDILEDKSERIRPSFGNHLSQLFASGRGKAEPPSPLDIHPNSDILSDGSTISSLPGSDSRNKSRETASASEAVAATSLLRDPVVALNPGPDLSPEVDEGAINDERVDPTQAEARFSPGVANSAKHMTSVGTRRKDSTTKIVQVVHTAEHTIELSIRYKISSADLGHRSRMKSNQVEDIDTPDAELKLPLIISKKDFGNMRVAGQFNMGFIIAMRPIRRYKNLGDTETSDYEELFIIDQHASDEKYNFEKLQKKTVFQSQRLVHPKRLQLTALEEEIVIDNIPSIEANGFHIDVDSTGNWPVGSRCQLLALPLSRETAFSLEDLEELIYLLGDRSSESMDVPRPTKVRKVFAMRACRSSIMIGRALTHSQMSTLVKHMGELDKPWNCPHGRPTMRHLCRLQAWNDRCWSRDIDNRSTINWRSYMDGGNNAESTT